MNSIKPNKLNAGKWLVPGIRRPAAVPAGWVGGSRGPGRSARIIVADLDLADGGLAAEKLCVSVLVIKAPPGRQAEP